MRVIKIVLSVILVMSVMSVVLHAPILNGMAGWLVVEDKLEKADAILVFAGDADGSRVAQAVELYKQGYGKKILMSGGPVIWKETYADNMRRQAFSLGVPAKDILIQASSESTYEDAKFSYPILKAHNIKSVILVTSPFHMRRALRSARRQFKNDIRVIAYPVQNSRQKVEGWWTRHEDTQAVVWELEALLFYTLKGI